MAAEPLTRPAGKLHEEDFVEWAAETARLLRSGRFDQVDIEHLAEEVEAMAGRDRRELDSRLEVLIHHLLKWQQQIEKRSGSWESTIISQRAAIRRLFEQSPSLRRRLAESVTAVYGDAVKEAAAETGLPVGSFPGACPFSAAEILDPDFLP